MNQTTLDPSEFFASANKVSEKVYSGEISGITQWQETEGNCYIEKVGIKKVGANNLITIFVCHDDFGRGNFGVFLPKVGANDFANAKRMEQLYATVYAAGGTKADKTVQEAFSNLSKKLADGKILCTYKLEWKESESATNGKTYKNQDLVMLKPKPTTDTNETQAAAGNGFFL